jgi:uncharacterized membrane protein required for colicin V production
MTGLAGITVIALIPTVAAYFGRRKYCPQFSKWMETEGLQIFVGVWITLTVVLLVLGL